MIKSRELIADNSSTICCFHFKLRVLSFVNENCNSNTMIKSVLKIKEKPNWLREERQKTLQKLHSSFQDRDLGSAGQILRSSQSCCQEVKLIICFSQRRQMFEKSHGKDKEDKLVKVFKGTDRYYLSVTAREVITLSFSFLPKILQPDWLHSCPSWSFKDRSLLINTGRQRCEWTAITQPIHHFI